MSRYRKRDGMIVHEEEPFNAETGLAALAEGAVTATDAFYVRGHGAVPEIDPAAWRLKVQGVVERELSLSLETLREALPEQEVTATLQCAGNRRAGLNAVRDIPGEAPWGPGATGTARWTGVALADVLALAGPTAAAAHVGFAGADLGEEAKPAQRFGGSIPLDKARRPEVLLAWAMNGEPLPTVHGAPLRVVVPGYIGARSVKWLERIELRSDPWPGYFQHVAYRLLPEDGTLGPGAGVPLGLVALIIVAAFLYDSYAFHITMMPIGIGAPIVATILWLLVALQYRDVFAPIFRAKSADARNFSSSARPAAAARSSASPDGVMPANQSSPSAPSGASPAPLTAPRHPVRQRRGARQGVRRAA